MSRMKKNLAELREKPIADLSTMLTERRKELFDVRMSSFTDQERSPAQIRNIRRQIARIHTVIRQKHGSRLQQDASQLGAGQSGAGQSGRKGTETPVRKR